MPPEAVQQLCHTYYLSLKQEKPNASEHAVSFSHLLLLSLSSGQSTVSIPPADVLQAIRSVDIPFNFTGKPISTWSGGALLTLDYPHSAAPVLRAFDATGMPLLQFAFNIPGASHIQMYTSGFSRGFDGSLGLVGSAYTNDSRGSTFVAWVSPDGKQQTVIRVSPFAAHAVTVAPDGSIWVAGREMVNGQENDPHHHILRRYDKTGTLLGSFLPRSSLDVVGSEFIHPAEKSFLFSSRDRIGWYSEASNTYLEFSPDGKVLNRFNTVEPDRNKLVLGFALCDDGGMFASAQLQAQGGGVAGWTIYALSRERGDWTSISRKEKWGILYGCDDTTLVGKVSGGSTIVWLANLNTR